jgi:hypothetical protein
MQSYQDIPDTTTLTASRSLLLNNILTALSQSSGTAFPTTNLVLGMPCYRTDLNKTYVLTNLTGPVWTLEQDNARTVAYLDDNVASATKLQTARTISISGDMTGSVSFDGTANAAITGTLAASGVTAGTYAAATITVDAKGRITSASATTSLVNTFNSRTGAVTLTSGDVTGALGFTPFGASATINRVKTDNISQGSYGSISVSGTNNGYAGINWPDVSTTYMTSQTASAHGLYKNNSTWVYYADNSGNFQTAAYGWLHNYFFSTVSNCSKMTENCGSRTGNCDNSANCLTVVANCGNVSQLVTVLEDGGSNVRVNGYKYNFNCNCNCNCDCCC